MKIEVRVADDPTGKLNEELLKIVQSQLADPQIERKDSSGEGKLAPGILEAFLVSLAAGATIEVSKSIHRWVTGSSKAVAVSLMNQDGSTRTFELKSGEPLPVEMLNSVVSDDQQN